MHSLTRRYRVGLIAGTVLALALGTAGCGQKAGGGSQNASVAQGFKVGFLLPEDKTTHYEEFDVPNMKRYVRDLCAKCEVVSLNAQQKADVQQTQADTLLTQGVKVLILDAVDYKSANSIVRKAKDQNVPVVAYDRFASGPVDYFVTFDNRKVGEKQGEALLKAVSAGGDPKRGQVVMINGSPTDPNAAEYKAGAHSVLDGKVNIGREFDTPDWSPDKANDEMTQAITGLGRDNIIGAYAANDGTASGAIAALRSAGANPIPPVTGQDAELAAVQRVIEGSQYMSVYKPYGQEAKVAAAMAVAVAQGKEYDGPTKELTNDSGDTVPSVLLPVYTMTKDQVKNTVLKDGLYTAAQICVGRYATFCQQLGIG